MKRLLVKYLLVFMAAALLPCVDQAAQGNVRHRLIDDERVMDLIFNIFSNSRNSSFPSGEKLLVSQDLSAVTDVRFDSVRGNNGFRPSMLQAETMKKISAKYRNIVFSATLPRGSPPQGYWDSFALQHPSTDGYYVISPVTYEDKGDAKVLVAHYCRVLCGSFGGVVNFKKIHGQWISESMERFRRN